MESRTQTMEERLEHEASECSKDLIVSLENFKHLVHEQYRTQFFEMIQTQLESAFFTGISKSRSIVRDRQEEIKDTAAEAAKLDVGRNHDNASTHHLSPLATCR